MNKAIHSPVTATIVVEHCDLLGVQARVNGQSRSFPNMQALFRAAVVLAKNGRGTIQSQPLTGRQPHPRHEKGP
jgi:hypothetical protein